MRTDDGFRPRCECTTARAHPNCPRRADASLAESSRALHDLDQAPAFFFRERTALLNTHRIAELGFVAFIVRFETRRLARDFAINPVCGPRLADHDDRLAHLVRNDASLFDASPVQTLRLLHGLPLLR